MRQHSIVGALVYNVAFATGAQVHAVLRENRLSNNTTGFRVVSEGGADNAEEKVVAHGNIAEQNRLGLLLVGGLDTLPTGVSLGANGSRLRFTSVGDAIWNNVGSGGVLVAGGFRRKRRVPPAPRITMTSECSFSGPAS